MSDTYLEHFGVKGMKWGKRKPDNAGPGPASKSRTELRELDRTARSEIRTKRAAEASKKRATQDKETAQSDGKITAARAEKIKTKAALKEAKKQYKSDKGEIGKVAAREVLRTVRDKHYDTVAMASQMTSGERIMKEQIEMTFAVADLTYSMRNPPANRP